MKPGEIINRLQALYKGNRFAFEMEASTYLAGDDKKSLRHQIILHVTGKDRPLKQCSHFATAEVLKNKFDSPTLF